MKKDAIKQYAIGFLVGALFSHIIGFFSFYELLSSFLDKQLFQVHGICIVGIWIFVFFTYKTAKELVKHSSKESRLLTESAIQRFEKVIDDALTPKKSGGRGKK